MNYAGNPSLAQDVQERISKTFQQTLDLVTEDRHQEALVGCEFILRMDPEFQPAKTLVSRLKGGERPVLIEDLKTSPAAAEDLGGLEDLDALDDLEDLGDLDDLDDLDGMGFDAAPAAAPPPVAPPPPASSPIPAPPPPAASSSSGASGLAAVIQDLIVRRNFEQILQIAETQKQSVESDEEVGRLVERARSLFESDAYVQAFLKSAGDARAAGRLEEMEKHLEKARSLDPEHPQVLAFAAAGTGPDEVLAFDDGDGSIAGGTAAHAGGTAADDDLLVLQQQSLSLDSEAPEKVADELARDPRQTNPMDAVTLDDAPTPPEAVAEDASEDLGADLFEDQSATAEAPEAAAGTVDELRVPFDDGGPAPDAAARSDPGAELELDDATFDDGGVAAPPAAESTDGSRVVELLDEGQQAFDRGDYQSAIDVWSRIFLIDIDNQEASQKIEEARSKKAEIERQAEELFHDAVDHLEAGSVEEAKRSLGEVLELLPSHSLAREYLEQLEAGKMPQISAPGELEAPSLEGLDGLDELSGPAEDSPSLEAAVERDRVVVVKKTDMRIVALGAAVLLAVVGIGAFLMLQWDVLFPNQEPPPQMTQQPRKVDPLERATKMHESDQTENAILLLERIQPQDPVYEDAQALIAQWKALVEAPPEPADTGPSEEQLARYNLLLGAARESHEQRRFLRARRYFERAGKILPLGADDQILVDECDDRLRPLQDEIEMFDDGQYSAIIPDLWRKRDSDPENLDIERLLVDSYYNLALTDLQRGNVGGAASKMQEALEIQPDNLELARLHLFAQTYAQRPQDLLYRIFVKYLPSR